MHSKQSLTNKTILMTGCSSGIGLHSALALHKSGWHVLATARKKIDVDKLTELGLSSYQLDLANAESVELAFNWAVSQSPNGIYALFNNGAYAQPGALEDINRALLTAQFETNVFGWHQLTRLCIQHMIQQSKSTHQAQGRIIQNSSVLGLVSMPYRGAYNASKYAIEGLSDTLRLELKGTNIKISLIEPGPIETRFRANALAQFEVNIDRTNSRFNKAYQKMLQRLETDKPSTAFTEPPESVHKRLMHALTAKHPKAHYYVTKPTYVIGFLKRILPTHWLDKIVSGF